MHPAGIYQYYKSCLTCPSAFPTVDEISPYVMHALSSFGYARSLWEGNWFFVDWYSPAKLDVYSTWVAATMSILGAATPQPTPDDIDNLFWRAGANAYRVA